jgi:hypothetical protein
MRLIPGPSPALAEGKREKGGNACVRLIESAALIQLSIVGKKHKMKTSSIIPPFSLDRDAITVEQEKGRG